MRGAASSSQAGRVISYRSLCVDEEGAGDEGRDGEGEEVGERRIEEG